MRASKNARLENSEPKLQQWKSQERRVWTNKCYFIHCCCLFGVRSVVTRMPIAVYQRVEVLLERSL